jgi:hypothetical protein
VRQIYELVKISSVRSIQRTIVGVQLIKIVECGGAGCKFYHEDSELQSFVSISTSKWALMVPCVYTTFGIRELGCVS